MQCHIPMATAVPTHIQAVPTQQQHVMTESQMDQNAKLKRHATDLAIPDVINVKLMLVPQRTCHFHAFLLKKIKLMLTIDPRQDGEALMTKVRDMLPRAINMITNEIKSAPESLGLVIEKLNNMSMEAVLNSENYALHSNDSIYELFKAALADPFCKGEITVNVEVLLSCTYRDYCMKGALEKSGQGWLGSILGTVGEKWDSTWDLREFSFSGNPYKADDDFETEGQLKWMSKHTGKMKAFVIERVEKDSDARPQEGDPNVLCVHLRRKQSERSVIKLRGDGLNKWSKQIHDFLLAVMYVNDLTDTSKTACFLNKTVAASGQDDRSYGH